MDRLSNRTLSAIAAPAALPPYDRSESRIGVVHLGPGAFFRAHQMSVYERLRASDPTWSACAVALRGPQIVDALTAQDSLYSLTELGGERRLQVMGALAEAIAARAGPSRVLARLAAAETRLVTLTVTEKGYPLDPTGDPDPGDPDPSNPDPGAPDPDAPEPGAPGGRQDLDPQAFPATAAGWVLAGLRARRLAGRAPFIVMSCDNLTGNSGRLKRAVLNLARARNEADLAGWIEAEALFPDTMVDSITPAADDALRTEVSHRLGVRDAAPVRRESFLQWVIDSVARPALGALAEAGATFSNDVTGYERAKLRLLNGAHSTLSYLGLLAGLQTVGEAVSDPRLAAFVERLMRQDLSAGLDAPEGLDVGGYIGAILSRFRNPDVDHRLAQIAADGSVKLPIRLLAPTEEAIARGGDFARLAVPVAAWMRFVAGVAKRGDRLDDPAGRRLLRLGEGCTGDASGDVARFLAETGVFPPALRDSAPYRAALERAYAALGGPDPLDALRGR